MYLFQGVFTWLPWNMGVSLSSWAISSKKKINFFSSHETNLITTLLKLYILKYCPGLYYKQQAILRWLKNTSSTGHGARASTLHLLINESLTITELFFVSFHLRSDCEWLIRKEKHKNSQVHWIAGCRYDESSQHPNWRMHG